MREIYWFYIVRVVLHSARFPTNTARIKFFKVQFFFEIGQTNFEIESVENGGELDAWCHPDIFSARLNILFKESSTPRPIRFHTSRTSENRIMIHE